MITDLSVIAGKNVVFFASTGGHLAQAVKWADRLNVESSSTFITFDNAQSRGLMATRRHSFIPYISPRDVSGVARSIWKLRKNASIDKAEIIVSTGAAIGLVAAVLAKINRKPFVYLESVSRFNGPSLTGRVLEYWPRTARFCQHPGYRRDRWTEVEPLLSAYRVEHRPETTDDRPLKVFISLGTIKPYRFDRLIDAIVPALRLGDQVTWQVGCTYRDDLPGDMHEHLTAMEFEKYVISSDVVVTHGGVGTLMSLLDAGQYPLVMSRHAENEEHVDDHQTQVVARLHELGIVREIKSEATRSDLLQAASKLVTGSSV